MGERKLRQTRKQRQLEKHPFCIYCGGDTKGKEVDHVPPKAIYTLKKRPEGMEFSACSQCHEGTRKLDSVASVFSRYFHGTGPLSHAEKEEYIKLIKGVMRFIPTIAQDMDLMHKNSSPVMIKHSQKAHITKLGDASKATLEAFAARVGLALHYYATGEILPQTGAIGVEIYTNVTALLDEMPDQLSTMFTKPKALIQKGLDAHKVFIFETVDGEDINGTASFAVFRQSFAIATICAENETELGSEFSEHFFRPGFLIGYPL